MQTSPSSQGGSLPDFIILLSVKLQNVDLVTKRIDFMDKTIVIFSLLTFDNSLPQLQIVGLFMLIVVSGGSARAPP